MKNMYTSMNKVIMNYCIEMFKIRGRFGRYIKKCRDKYEDLNIVEKLK